MPLSLLPRLCPLCGERTIIGHGRRRKQAHDQLHDFIYIRRGRCRPCRKTFTILPTWSPPHGHYSLHCRHQAALRVQQQHGGWEQVAPHIKDPNRLPDPSTLRRWAVRRLVSLWCWMRSRFWQTLGGNFLSAPTILAWDFIAVGRILLWETKGP